MNCQSLLVEFVARNSLQTLFPQAWARAKMQNARDWFQELSVSTGMGESQMQNARDCWFQELPFSAVTGEWRPFDDFRLECLVC
jgi:hypothetical protein